VSSMREDALLDKIAALVADRDAMAEALADAEGRLAEAGL